MGTENSVGQHRGNQYTHGRAEGGGAAKPRAKSSAAMADATGIATQAESAARNNRVLLLIAEFSLILCR